jgi:hypothetical protein
VKGKGEHSDEEDLLKYRPNPDMMDTKSAPDGQVMLFPCLLIHLLFLHLLKRCHMFSFVHAQTTYMNVALWKI